MKNLSLLLIYLSTSVLILNAQTYEVGHTSITFNDPQRSRDIQTELYYPAISGGEDVAMASGVFPVIVFGHGFVMAWDSYDNFWTEYVSQGYIMLFPRTEGNMSPDHGEFGLDLAFLIDAIQDENQNISSIFYGGVGSESAVMGHSMGGGASFLAAAANSNITTLVNFGAAETTPSAIDAATSIAIPTVVFSGAEDCVAQPGGHQIPMYDSLFSDCKTHISINNGGHCYFANYNLNCTFGESTCLPVVPIAREEQHDVCFDFLTLWLNYTLKGDQNAFTVFNDSLVNSGRITYQQHCTITKTDVAVSTSNTRIYPNPVKDMVYIESTGKIKNVELYNVYGRMIRKLSNPHFIKISNLESGVYYLKLFFDKRVETHVFVKQ